MLGDPTGIQFHFIRGRVEAVFLRTYLAYLKSEARKSLVLFCSVLCRVFQHKRAREEAVPECRYSAGMQARALRAGLRMGIIGGKCGSSSQHPSFLFRSRGIADCRLRVSKESLIQRFTCPSNLDAKTEFKKSPSVPHSHLKHNTAHAFS